MTSLAIECPTGTYARIAPRSRLPVNNQSTSLAGVVDPDFRGEVKAVLHNFGTSTQYVKYKQKVAQLIFEQAKTPDVELTKDLTSTTQQDEGFGSTEKEKLHHNTQNNLAYMCIRENIDPTYEPTTVSSSK